jgi:hypothetical protein
MSRSGYTEDCDDNWSLICWRGAVQSSIRGKRGQGFLAELLEALEGLPEKALIANDLEADGAYCALGAVGARRGIDMSKIDPYDRETVAATFNIAPALAAEIVWMNDEFGFHKETPEARFNRMRAWVASNIVKS